MITVGFMNKKIQKSNPIPNNELAFISPWGNFVLGLLLEEEDDVVDPIKMVKKKVPFKIFMIYL